MNKPSVPCHFCDHREMDCHTKCEAYKTYCSEIAKIHELVYASKEKDAEYLGYAHHKHQKRKG